MRTALTCHTLLEGFNAGTQAGLFVMSAAVRPVQPHVFTKGLHVWDARPAFPSPVRLHHH